MIKTFICDSCGAYADVLRFENKNMPVVLDCTCGGKASPDTRPQAPGLTFKGEGWTPPTHTSEAVLDLGEDNE